MMRGRRDIRSHLRIGIRFVIGWVSWGSRLQSGRFHTSIRFLHRSDIEMTRYGLDMGFSFFGCVDSLDAANLICVGGIVVGIRCSVLWEI